VKIAIGSDHRGLDFKKYVTGLIAVMGFSYQDFGSYTPEPVDYPDIAKAVSNAVAKGKFDYGILICGTGLRLKERTLTMHEANKIGRRTGVNSPRLLSQILFDLKAKYRDIYHLIDGRWEYKPRVPDRALLFLEEAGHPLEFEVLAEKCRTTYHNLVNRISPDDHQIVRVGRHSYGLRKWGYVPYSGIVGGIHDVLEESGGQAEIEYIVDKVAEQYGVSTESVKQYSKVHRDFILENGLLRVRNSQDLAPGPSLIDLGQVSGCLYISGQPAVRIRINDSLWKGSGWATPKVWASKVGGHPGEKILLGNKDRGVILTWLGKEPSLGSMRKLAFQDGWPNEGFAFIIVSPTGLHTLTMPLPPGPKKDPKVIVKAVSSLFAMPECQEYPPSTPFWLTLGSRLGLSPDQSEADFVLKRLKSRRDRLLAPYLKMLRSVRYKI
jgi:hypothetical protein